MHHREHTVAQNRKQLTHQQQPQRAQRSAAKPFKKKTAVYDEMGHFKMCIMWLLSHISNYGIQHEIAV
jgi:hypothetical protein